MATPILCLPSDPGVTDHNAGMFGTRPTIRLLDCPIHKYHDMRREQSTCGGRPVRTMAEIRVHLSHRGSLYGGFPSYLRLCRRCGNHVTDEATWVADSHATGTCMGSMQLGNSNVIRWAQSYLSLYPSETRVPNPYKYFNVVHL